MANVMDGIAFDSYCIHYDAEGNPAFISRTVNNAVSIGISGGGFAYLKNIQGDNIRLVNESDAVALRYCYESWGTMIIWRTDFLT